MKDKKQPFRRFLQTWAGGILFGRMGVTAASTGGRPYNYTFNKKILLAVFIAALFFAAQGAQASDYGMLAEVVSTSFLPTSIHAGDVITIAAKINNRGTSIPMEGTTVSIDAGSQFEQIDADAEIGTIRQGAQKTAIFTLRAKQDTPVGYYPATIMINYARGESLISQDENILIPVSRTERNIEVKVSPSVINPGNPTQISFTLDNAGDSAISNILFSWQESDNLILPLGSDNRRYVGIIMPGGQETATYTVAADPNITPGIYSLDVSVNFTDSNGTRAQASKVGLIIGGGTDFEVSAQNASGGQLSLSIANIGANNAQSVVVRVPRQAAAGITSEATQILGNLNRGDFTIATVETQQRQVSSSSASGSGNAANRGMGIGGFGRVLQGPQQATGQSGQVQQAIRPDRNSTASELDVQIEYTDTTGQRQSVPKKVQLAAQAFGSISGTDESGQRGQGLPFLPIGLLVMFAAGAAAYNHFRAKKSWIDAGKIIGAIIALFLAAIFVFASGIIAVLLAAAISASLLWWAFLHKGK